MKLKLIIILLLIPLLSSCKKISDNKNAGYEDFQKFMNYSEVPCFGVVIASALNSRSEPKLNSQAKVTFQFGTPLVFVERTSLKENIDGKEDYWYREKETGVWFFGGFLVKTQFNLNFIKSGLISVDFNRIRLKSKRTAAETAKFDAISCRDCAQ